MSALPRHQSPYIHQNQTETNNLICYDFKKHQVITPKKTTDVKKIKKDNKENKDNEGSIPVQPIVGDDIQRVKDYIFNRPSRYKTIDFNLRDYTMFCFNINIGLRITDFLSLKIKDVLVNGKIIDCIRFKEGKNKKNRELLLLPEVQEQLMAYINSLKDWKPDWYLFHNIWPHQNPYKPMTRENMWQKMNKIEEELEFAVPLGTHSMRKTFARAMFDKLSETDPMAILIIQKMLGHSSPETTLAYIGITREKAHDLRREVGFI